MKITMCKSQGRTLKEVHVEFNKDEYTTRGLGFVADPFFTEHIKTLENLQKKQCESGLEFNMEKMKKIVGWTWPDAPEGVRKAIIDADQLWESFGPSRSSGKSCIDAMEKFQNIHAKLPEVTAFALSTFTEHSETVMARANAEIEASLNNLIVRTGINALVMKPLGLEDKE